MRLKIRNIFTILISAILYTFFYSKNNIPPQLVETATRVVILNQENIDELQVGNWIVTTTIITPDISDLLGGSNYNLALLLVDNYENAKIAAKLGMKKANEVIFLKNNKIINNSEEKKMRENISSGEVIDYLVFYRILHVKKMIETHKSFESCILALCEYSPQIFANLF